MIIWGGQSSVRKSMTINKLVKHHQYLQTCIVELDGMLPIASEEDAWCTLTRQEGGWYAGVQDHYEMKQVRGMVRSRGNCINADESIQR